MSQRHQALAIAVLLAAVVSTPTHARHQKTLIQNTPIFDQHSNAIGAASRGAIAPSRSYQRTTRIVRRASRHRGTSVGRSDHHGYRAPTMRISGSYSSPYSTSRDCLHSSARDVLARLEARFGKVTLVSTCRPGARMPNGDLSLHHFKRAFDFKVGRGVDKRDVMVWLGKNSPGVTMSYRSMDHIHTDTGTFHKVIYNAASHEAGERAVAIWKARAEAPVQVASLPPRPEREVPAPLVATEPTLEEYEVDPHPVWPLPSAPPPEPERNIFARFFASREIVVQPHVTFSCPGGNPMPRGIQAMLMDTSLHFAKPVTVNSAYRSKQYNDALRRRGIRAARNSQHIQCKAVDFRVAGVSIADLRRYVVANLTRWGVKGLGTYSTFLHADVRSNTTKLVTWSAGQKRYAKRRYSRYAALR